jgi:hypothetical protein
MSSTGTIARDDTLVAVAAGHLVARLKLALHGDEDLDHLHARPAAVRRRCCSLSTLLVEAGFETCLARSS